MNKRKYGKRKLKRSYKKTTRKKRTSKSVQYVGSKGKNFMRQSYQTLAIIPYTNGTAGGVTSAANASGPIWSCAAGGSVGYWAHVMKFDPFGGSTQGYYGDQGTGGSSIAISTGSATYGRPPEMYLEAANWYYYKVNRISMHFYVRDKADLDYGSIELYIRRSDEYTASVPTFETVSDQIGWVKKSFTNLDKSFTFSFVPKMQQVSDGTTLNSSRRPIRMPFLRTNVSTPLYGVQVMVVIPGGGSAAECQLCCDVHFSVSWRDKQI